MLGYGSGSLVRGATNDGNQTTLQPEAKPAALLTRLSSVLPLDSIRDRRRSRIGGAPERTSRVGEARSTSQPSHGHRLLLLGVDLACLLFFCSDFVSVFLRL